MSLFFAISLLFGSVTGSVLLAQTLPAQGTPSGSTEITLFAGISAPVNGETKGFGLDVKTATPIGGRVSYNFDQHKTVEFSIANPFSLSANYVYNFSAVRGKWVPYMTAGVGGTRREIALSDNNQPAQLNASLVETGPDRGQTAFTGNFGGGLKYFFTERFALRFDVRDQVGHYRATFGNVAGVPGGIVTGSKTLNDLQLSGGIAFRIGRTLRAGTSAVLSRHFAERKTHQTDRYECHDASLQKSKRGHAVSPKCAVRRQEQANRN